MMAKIFISWSGETSHKIALILRDWLPALVHEADTWVSSEDIVKGDRWGLELSKQLSETSFGIICLDPTNLQSPWLNFEAGALSKSIEHGKVFPLLFGIPPNEFRGPLAQFQATTFNKDDMYRLIRSLNLAVGASKMPPDRLYKTFELTWPGLLSSIEETEIPQVASQTGEKATEINAKSQVTKLDIPDSDILILKVLIPDGHSIAKIAEETNFPEKKVSYCLKRLQDQKFVNENEQMFIQNGHFVAGWYILEKGVGLLVDNGII
jgi:predicted transcriptional regulator